MLFDLRTGRSYGLNETGVAIWKLLDGTRTKGEMLDELRSTMDGVPEDLAEQLDGFLVMLYQNGLLTAPLSAVQLTRPPSRAPAV
jgi:hypothetical protein